MSGGGAGRGWWWWWPMVVLVQRERERAIEREIGERRERTRGASKQRVELPESVDTPTASDAAQRGECEVRDAGIPAERSELRLAAPALLARGVGQSERAQQHLEPALLDHDQRIAVVLAALLAGQLVDHLQALLQHAAGGRDPNAHSVAA